MSTPTKNTYKRPLIASSAAAALLGTAALISPAAGSANAAATAADTTPVKVCLTGSTSTTAEFNVTLPKVAVDPVLQATASYLGPCASYGTPSALGNGNVRTYAQQEPNGKPISMGFVFPKATLQNLPTTMTDQHHCYDINGNGVIDEHTECMGGHERPLDLPAALTSTADIPYKWALLNYNSMGHGPEGIYDTPHFDFHFYVQPKAERDAIRPGPCALAINCDDFATATKPIPAQYMPSGYIDNGVAEVAMGNHLIDQSSPEWHGQKFTQTFIYGAYDAKISFLEPMITKAYFDGLVSGTNPNGCFPIKQPQSWQVAGWYPMDYCIKYRANRGDFTVSMENYQHS
ncbi:hypothetical protein BX265_3496 [Streptomyces sp. TLI_235]|nr:hypothetical protein [Streptomyces sp. TLI_235]PBC78717.1 hypothetical protein BX265_3496 [Streptomyces sp. TLI_235]